MYRERRPEITLCIDEIAKATGADMSPEDIRSRHFWNACREAREYFDTVPKQGLEIEFEPTVIREGPSMHMMCYDPSGIRIEFYYPGQG